MILHVDSHVDHGLTLDQIRWITSHFKDKDSFFIETFKIPTFLGTIPCHLHGPLMGDDPVPESEVYYDFRGDRKGPSRLVKRNRVRTFQMTVIGGPHESEPCILYTAYGGPYMPREPWDCKNEEERVKSMEIWSEHALSIHIPTSEYEAE